MTTLVNQVCTLYFCSDYCLISKFIFFLEQGLFFNRSNGHLNTLPRSFRYSKKRLRGPYGEMLEEEMRKSSFNETQDKFQAHFGFLQDLTSAEKQSEKNLSNTKNRSSLSSIKSDSAAEIINGKHSGLP